MLGRLHPSAGDDRVADEVEGSGEEAPVPDSRLGDTLAT